jgi:hypothetical protein
VETKKRKKKLRKKRKATKKRGRRIMMIGQPKKITVSISKNGIVEKQWSVEKNLPQPPRLFSISPPKPLPVNSQPRVSPPQPVAAKKAGCNCGKKAETSTISSPTIVNMQSITQQQVQQVPRVAGNNIIVKNAGANNRSITTKEIQPGIPSGETKDWGNPTWNYMHTQAYFYPAKPTESEKYKKLQLFKSIIENIPCHTCEREAGLWIIDHPLDKAIVNNCVLSQWVLDFHNFVNERLERSKWTMEQLVAKFGFKTFPCTGF